MNFKASESKLQSYTSLFFTREILFVNLIIFLFLIFIVLFIQHFYSLINYSNKKIHFNEFQSTTIGATAINAVIQFNRQIILIKQISLFCFFCFLYFCCFCFYVFLLLLLLWFFVFFLFLLFFLFFS